MPKDYEDAIIQEQQFRILANDMQERGCDPRLIAIACTQAEGAFMFLRKASFTEGEHAPKNG